MFELLIAHCFLAAPSIVPSHLYNGVNRSVMVEIELPNGEDVGHIVLLDSHNKQLCKPVAVTAGQHDLLRRLPTINDLPHAAWAQLLIDGSPVGTPVVVEPLRSRLVPVVEQVSNDGGETHYIKIVDWKDEAVDDEFEESILNGWRVYEDKDVVIWRGKLIFVHAVSAV